MYTCTMAAILLVYTVYEYVLEYSNSLYVLEYVLEYKPTWLLIKLAS
jgi:hypothetical protein